MNKRTLSWLLIVSMLLPMALPLKAIAETEMDVQRLAGGNRYQTAVKVSAASFGQAESVVIASGESFPDALAGGQLAVAVKGPILLTPKGALHPETKGELIRLGAKKIYILGGGSTIQLEVETELKKLGTTERLGGKNRYDTSILIAKKARELGMKKELAVASGASFADALAAGGFIAATECTMALSNGQALPNLETSKPIVFGGINTLQLAGYSGERISGSNRYATALKIAQKIGGKPQAVILVSGLNYPDALTAISLAKKEGAPILLTGANGLDGGSLEYIRANFTRVLIVGGESSVPRVAVSQVKGVTGGGQTVVTGNTINGMITEENRSRQTDWGWRSAQPDFSILSQHPSQK